MNPPSLSPTPEERRRAPAVLQSGSSSPVDPDARGVRKRVLAATNRKIEPDAFLGVLDLCDVMGTSRSFWDKLRVSGGGPRYCMIGRQIRYRWRDVLRWCDGVAVSSTSDDRPTKGAGRASPAGDSASPS